MTRHRLCRTSQNPYQYGGKDDDRALGSDAPIGGRGAPRRARGETDARDANQPEEGAYVPFAFLSCRRGPTPTN
jgi:hypothetical protein